MNQVEERNALTALRGRNFPFIDTDMLDSRIASLSTVTADGDLTALKASLRAQIEAGNPSGE